MILRIVTAFTMNKAGGFRQCIAHCLMVPLCVTLTNFWLPSLMLSTPLFIFFGRNLLPRAEHGPPHYQNDNGFGNAMERRGLVD